MSVYPTPVLTLFHLSLFCSSLDPDGPRPHWHWWWMLLTPPSDISPRPAAPSGISPRTADDPSGISTTASATSANTGGGYPSDTGGGRQSYTGGGYLANPSAAGDGDGDGGEGGLEGGGGLTRGESEHSGGETERDGGESEHSGGKGDGRAAPTPPLSWRQLALLGGLFCWGSFHMVQYIYI